MVHVKSRDRRSGVKSDSERKDEVPCLKEANETTGLAVSMLGQTNTLVSIVY